MEGNFYHTSPTQIWPWCLGSCVESPVSGSVQGSAYIQWWCALGDMVQFLEWVGLWAWWLWARGSLGQWKSSPPLPHYSAIGSQEA